MQNPQRHIALKRNPGQKHAFGANRRLLFVSFRTGRPATPAATYVKIVAPGLLTATLWTHLWLGLTGSVVLAIASAFLLLSIPRLPLRSRRRDGLAMLVGYGERIWLSRLIIPIPSGISHRLTVLYLVFWTGCLTAVLGALTTLPILSATGLLVAYCAQAVSFRNLIQLYRMMRDKDPLYRFWTASAANDNRQVGSARKRA